jgi:hypothetical protein
MARASSGRERGHPHASRLVISAPSRPAAAARSTRPAAPPGSTGSTGSTGLDQLKISYANGTFSDAGEGSAALKPGSRAAGAFIGTGPLTESGALIRGRIRTADNFQGTARS